MRNRRPRRRRGFTLMEVLLVLAILVILGSMVTVGFFKIKQNADKDSAKAQIKLLESGVDMYTLAIGTPPSTQQGLESLLAAPSDIKNPAKWRGPYLNKEQLPMDPWGNPYQYEQTGEDFRIWSNGPDGNSGSDDDVSTDTP
jgi:general secretion pathway protein G